MPLVDNDNVWRSPLREMKLRRLDPRNHDHDAHGEFRYKTNREVDFRSLVFAQEFANRFHRWLTFVIAHMCSAPAVPVRQYTTPRGEREFRDEGDEGQKLQRP